MELTFNKTDNKWVAEFEAAAHFNLHLERDSEGRLDIYSNGVIADIPYQDRKLVVDMDFAVAIPKIYKIISVPQPTSCLITAVGGDENITIIEPERPEPEVTFPLYFTSDSVRIEDDSAGGLGGFYQSAYYTFDLGKMNDGTYWTDYLFDYYKSKMEFLEYGYDIPGEVAEQIPIFFNGCRVTYASSTYTTLEEITKDSLGFELEQNFPPLEGYEFAYAWDSIKIYWKEGGIMEVMVAVKKIS